MGGHPVTVLDVSRTKDLARPQVPDPHSRPATHPDDDVPAVDAAGRETSGEGTRRPDPLVLLEGGHQVVEDRPPIEVPRPDRGVLVVGIEPDGDQHPLAVEMHDIELRRLRQREEATVARRPAQTFQIEAGERAVFSGTDEQRRPRRRGGAQRHHRDRRHAEDRRARAQVDDGQRVVVVPDRDDVPIAYLAGRDGPYRARRRTRHGPEILARDDVPAVQPAVDARPTRVEPARTWLRSSMRCSPGRRRPCPNARTECRSPRARPNTKSPGCGVGVTDVPVLPGMSKRSRRPHMPPRRRAREEPDLLHQVSTALRRNDPLAVLGLASAALAAFDPRSHSPFEDPARPGPSCGVTDDAPRRVSRHRARQPVSACRIYSDTSGTSFSSDG